MKLVIPKHIGIIVDGNRRWAQKNGLPSWQGHEQGYQNLKKIAGRAFDKGVCYLTIYAFSTENWKRRKTEIIFLFKLIKRLVAEEVNVLHRDGIRLSVLGDISRFDLDLQRNIIAAQKLTARNTKGVLNVCLNYGGRQEIISAVNKFIKSRPSTETITEDDLENHLYTVGQPDPDLIIRTSGEQRLSNFLTWQGVYSELYFSSKLWPDFNIRDLDLAIRNYGERQRRFGK
ncbi:MAG: di-trans,poly-cis-decaprenylcistransferase [Parcubacteria group bacterium]|nr:MAG: di-trans,poly-cis-decaprenylcistransferase [Parcubacteria group bacterium]